MIAFVFGTTGELIKIAPVIAALQDAGERPLLVTTAQQVEQIPHALEVLGLPAPDLWLGRGRDGRDLETIADIPIWLRRVARSFAARRGWLRERLENGSGRPLVIVHGDTMTTVLGASMGRALGVPVAHIEAGLRSGDLRNPFPEELNRRIVSRIAGTHFAPGSWAAGNLRKARVRGDIVDTGSNTVADSLRLAAERPVRVGFDLPERFGLVSVHRFELLGDAEKLRELLVELSAAAERTPLLFVDHPVTVAAIEQHGLQDVFSPGLRRVQRLAYPDFIALLGHAAFMLTDSGGSQEECTQLGIPCLVHRAATERLDGLEGPVTLSHYDMDVVRRFLAEPGERRPPVTTEGPTPTGVIVDHLRAEGFLGG